MPSTVFPAPGGLSLSKQWNTYTETATASSSGTTVTLSGRTLDTGQIGSAVSVTSGTGQFAANTVITAASYINTYSVSIGSGQSLTVPNTGTNAAFTFAGNFTVEGWFYPTVVTGSDHALFCLGTEAANRYVWYITAGGASLSSNLFGAATKTYPTSTIAANTWNHIAISRTGSTVSVFLNGTLLATTDTQAGTIGNGVVKIGSDSGGVANFAGYISNFRVVSGAAVYTSTFTLPTAALAATQSANANGNPSTAITGTQTSVLTCQNATIIDNGTANTGVGFTVGNTGSVITIASVVPGNTFTVNLTPTVALSSASISISTSGVIAAPDNRRTTSKASTVAQARSVTDNRRVTTNLQKRLTVARSVTDNRRVVSKASRITQARSIPGEDIKFDVLNIQSPFKIKSSQISVPINERTAFSVPKASRITQAKGMPGEDIKFDASNLQKPIEIVRSGDLVRFVAGRARSITQARSIPLEDVKFDVLNIQAPFKIKSSQIAGMPGEDIKFDASNLQKPIEIVRSGDTARFVAAKASAITKATGMPGEDIKFDVNNLQKQIEVIRSGDTVRFVVPNLRSPFKIKSDQISSPVDERAAFTVSKASRVSQAKGMPGEDVKFDTSNLQKQIAILKSTVSIPTIYRLSNFDVSAWTAYNYPNTVIVGYPNNIRNIFTYQSSNVSSVGNTTTITASINSYSPTGTYNQAGDYMLITDTVTGKQVLAQQTSTTVTIVPGTYPVTVQLGQATFSNATVTGTNGSYVGTVGMQHQYTWTCPANVYSVAVVCIGAGGGLIQGSLAGPPYNSGGGGANIWANNIPVVPGVTYTIYSGIGGNGVNNGGASSFTSGPITISAGGGQNNGGLGGTYSTTLTSGFGTTWGGGNGGRGQVAINSGTGRNGGGGAGGYAGDGGAGGIGDGTTGITGQAGQPAAANSGGGGGGGASSGSGAGGAGGGGVGLLGIGTTGTGGAGGSANGAVAPTGGGGGSSGGSGSSGAPGLYGGGGTINTVNFQYSGAVGGVRIMWPGNKLSDGSTVRSYGATAGATTLATDQSGTVLDGTPSITFTVSTSAVTGLNPANPWNIQPWFIDLAKQTNVLAIGTPANARENLFYFSQAPGLRTINRNQLTAGIPGDNNYVATSLQKQMEVIRSGDTARFVVGRASSTTQVRNIPNDYASRAPTLLEKSRLIASDRIAAMNYYYDIGRAASINQAKGILGEDVKFDASNLQKQIEVIRSGDTARFVVGRAASVTQARNIPNDYESRAPSFQQRPFLIKSSQIAAMPNLASQGKASSTTQARSIADARAASSLQKQLEVIRSTADVPVTYRLSNIDSTAWYYQNKVVVGSNNPRFPSYLSAVTSKSTSGSNTTLQYVVPQAYPTPSSNDYILLSDLVSGQNLANILSYGGTSTTSSAAGQQLYTVSGSTGTLGAQAAPAPTGNSYIYTFIPPAGVTSVSVVAVGGGGSGGSTTNAAGGGGGALAWAAAIPVIPGIMYTVVVGGGGINSISAYPHGQDSYFISPTTLRAGGGSGNPLSSTIGVPGGTYYVNPLYAGGGGNGGNSGTFVGTGGPYESGGGGAGGYSGNGGTGGGASGNSSGTAPTAGSGGGGGGGGAAYDLANANSGSGAGGGGVGLLGQSTSGAAGTNVQQLGTPTGGGGGSGGTAGATVTGAGANSLPGAGGTYGGGGGGGNGQNVGAGVALGASGGPGGIRIMWPGVARQYPTTLTTDQTTVTVYSATVTVPTASLTNVNASNAWYAQIWDPEFIPQANVQTINTTPATARENLYYFNVSPGLRAVNRSNFSAGMPGEDAKYDVNLLQRPFLINSRQIAAMNHYADIGRAASSTQAKSIPFVFDKIGRLVNITQAKSISGEYDRRAPSFQQRPFLIKSSQIAAMPGENYIFDALRTENDYWATTISPFNASNNTQTPYASSLNPTTPRGWLNSFRIAPGARTNRVFANLATSVASTVSPPQLIDRFKIGIGPGNLGSGFFDVAYRPSATVSGQMEPIQFWN